MVTDPNGMEDIQRVFFTLQKPDGSFGGEEETTGGFEFLLFDDGNPKIGDAKEGDSVFSWRFPVVGDALLGTYEFTLYAQDWAGLLSPEIKRPMELVSQ